VDLSDTQWLQASLPVRYRGLGNRSVCMLAPAAFLASAASTHDLQRSVLPEFIRSSHDEAITRAEASCHLEARKLPSSHSTSNVRGTSRLVSTIKPCSGHKRPPTLTESGDYLAGCTTYHISGSATLRWGCQSKGKAEHLYSALHGIGLQTTLKRSGMEHTVLPTINAMSAFTWPTKMEAKFRTFSLPM